MFMIDVYLLETGMFLHHANVPLQLITLQISSIQLAQSRK